MMSNKPTRKNRCRKGGITAQRNRDESAACARPTFHQPTPPVPWARCRSPAISRRAASPAASLSPAPATSSVRGSRASPCLGMDRKVARRGRGVQPPDGARTRPECTVETCRPGLRIEEPFGRSGPSCRQRLRTGLAGSVSMPVKVGLMTFRIRPTRLIECRLKSPLLPGKVDERHCILE